MEGVATSTNDLIAQRDGHVAWLTFNRPEKHNALSAEMFAGLSQLTETWNADAEVRVVVMQGAGHAAFCSGADIGRLDNGIDHGRSTGNRPMMFRMSKPVIAMIQGFCIGGGLALAMEADLRVASPDAVFGIPAGRLGVAYPQDAVDRLVAMVGATHASHLLLTAERINAAQALAIGLINEIVPANELRARVTAHAQAVAANAPLSMIAAKLSIQSSLRGGQPGDRDAAEQAARNCWASDDFAEGRQAFAQKRPPNWVGH
jgi:enoyl-CoA hydratase